MFEAIYYLHTMSPLIIHGIIQDVSDIIILLKLCTSRLQVHVPIGEYFGKLFGRRFIVGFWVQSDKWRSRPRGPTTPKTRYLPATIYCSRAIRCGDVRDYAV